MEFMIAGCLLIASAAVLDVTKRLKRKTLNSVENARGFEFIGATILGLFLFAVGMVGLVAGFYSAKLTARSVLVLSFLLYSLEIQIRLLVRQKNSAFESGSTNNSSNITQVLKEAYSIGLFPSGSDGVYWIYVCQFSQLIIFGVFVFV